MTNVYILSLAVIAILSIITHFVLQSVIEEQSETGLLVNKSGQQRMLSQRASLFAIEFLKTGNEEAKLLTLSALQQLEENHSFLIKPHVDAIKDNKPSPMSPKMQSLYFKDPVNIDKNIQQFREYILFAVENQQSDIKSEREQNELIKPFLDMARLPFLSSLNSVVSQYEKESVLDIAELKLAQNVVLVIVMLTILLEALFVFRPMVSRISQFAKQLQHEANYDHLSNIYNRRAFFMVTEKLIQLPIRNNEPFSIILMDIDKFKAINDTYGHDAGDMVIFELAQLLKRELRNADVVARFGGEEFIIFMSKTSLSNAVLIAEKITTLVENTDFSLGDINLKVTVSSGVTEGSASDGLDFAIKRADERLYKAKTTGRNRVCGEDGIVEYTRHMTMQDLLKTVVDSGELSLVMQPQYTNEGRVNSFEALIRWHSSVLGWVSPADFIPLAEQSGAIVKIGDWVLLHACLAIQELMHKGLQASISVNISAQQIIASDFTAKLIHLVHKLKIPPQMLVLEITETALIIDIAIVKAAMSELASQGFSFSIDDFGTGYSSLAYLKELPISELKIDKYFVDDIDVNQPEKSYAIVDAIVEMARALGIKSVAEGVETEEQFAYLKKKGCNLYQGYLFSKPIDMDDWRKLVDKETIRKVG